MSQHNDTGCITSGMSELRSVFKSSTRVFLNTVFDILYTSFYLMLICCKWKTVVAKITALQISHFIESENIFYFIPPCFYRIVNHISKHSCRWRQYFPPKRWHLPTNPDRGNLKACKVFGVKHWFIL